MMKNNHLLAPALVGAVMVGFGVHQLMNSRKWVKYIPEPISEAVPLKDELIIKAHASANVSLGLLYILFRSNPAVRWIVAGWWLNVMLICGHYRIKEGVRDIPFFLTTLAYAIEGTKSQPKNT